MAAKRYSWNRYVAPIQGRQSRLQMQWLLAGNVAASKNYGSLLVQGLLARGRGARCTPGLNHLLIACLTGAEHKHGSTHEPCILAAGCLRHERNGTQWTDESWDDGLQVTKPGALAKQVAHRK
jgi:hypothetical protein